MSGPPQSPMCCENPSRCYLESASTCGAGQLPRITENDWSETDLSRFRARAERGTVAVAYARGKARLVPDCSLDGTYTEVLAQQPGEGRLWATNRVLLLPREVTGTGCAGATHLVAAFAAGGAWFAAIVVPLPCPSVTDREPARTCVGSGLDGAARLARAPALAAKIPPREQWSASRAYVPEVLDVYALAPDDPVALHLLTDILTECALKEQAGWISRQYLTRRTLDGTVQVVPNPSLYPPDNAPPHLDENQSARSCLYQPAFRKCFPALFEPSAGTTGCWAPVAKATGARMP